MRRLQGSTLALMSVSLSHGGEVGGSVVMSGCGVGRGGGGGCWGGFLIPP